MWRSCDAPRWNGRNESLARGAEFEREKYFESPVSFIVKMRHQTSGQHQPAPTVDTKLFLLTKMSNSQQRAFSPHRYKLRLEVWLFIKSSPLSLIMRWSLNPELIQQEFQWKVQLTALGFLMTNFAPAGDHNLKKKQPTASARSIAKKNWNKLVGLLFGDKGYWSAWIFLVIL